MSSPSVTLLTQYWIYFLSVLLSRFYEMLLTGVSIFHQPFTHNSPKFKWKHILPAMKLTLLNNWTFNREVIETDALFRNNLKYICTTIFICSNELILLNPFTIINPICNNNTSQFYMLSLLSLMIERYIGIYFKKLKHM